MDKGDNMTTIQYKVPSISCHHCAHTIKMELQEVKGVNSVDVDVESKAVTVSFDPPANEGVIEKLLEEINYPVQKP